MEPKRLDLQTLEVTSFEVSASQAEEDYTGRTQCSKCQQTD